MDKTLKNNTAYRKTNEKYLNEVKKGKSKKSTGKQIQELIRSVAKEEKYRLETKFECILKECNIDKNTEIVNSLLREIPNLICISKENQLTKIPIFPEAFIRKLILDFMFDLEQTKVFQISPHYEHISVKLKENYLFSALAAKANFYYWKEICSRILLEKNEKKDEKIKELTDKRAKKLQQLDRLVTRKSDWERKVSGCIICLHQDNLKKRIGREVINLLKIKIKDIISDIFEIENQIEDVQSKNISPIYAEYYLNAELQWTKAIRNPKAQTNFNDYQGRWFDDPELEMDRVYKAEKFIDNKKEKGKLTNEKFKARIERSRKLTSKWYMERFSWIIRKDFTGWHQLLLRFIAAIATAWMLTLIGSDLLPAYTNDDPNVIENFFSQDKDGNSILWWTIAFYVILLLISGRVISYQIKQKSRGIGRDEKISRRIKIFLCRPFAVIVLCSVYSIILGMIMGLFSNKYCMPWSKESGSELSPFFVTGVVLAVFIGIVLESVTGKDGQEES
jgi:hypothetical protein